MTDVPEPGLGSTDWKAWADEQEQSSDDLRSLTVNVKDYGAVGDGVADDTAAFTNALAAAGGGANPGSVIAPRGTYKISGQVTIADGVSLFGAGANGNSGFSATKLLLSGTGAGVTVNGSGGYLADLFIDGNNSANYPLVSTVGANRTFFRVDVRRALLDNWTFQGTQNASVISCTSDNSTRDAYVLDLGAGGIQFLRANSSDPGRYAVRVDQTGTSPTGAYTDQPQHNQFEHCIFERPTSDNPLVKFVKGFYTGFDNCVFAASAPMTSASALLDIGTNVDWITTDACEFHGGGISGIIAARLASGANLNVSGRNWLISAGYFVDAPTSATVQMNGDVFLSGATFATAGTSQGGDSPITHSRRYMDVATRAATGNVNQASQITGEAGQRYRVLADGTLQWGDGSGFTFATQLYRRTDGLVGVDGGLAVNGTNFAVRGSTPVTKPTVTGSRGSNAALASLLTALANQGLITDSST